MTTAYTYSAPYDMEKLSLLHSSAYDVENGAGMGIDTCASEKDTPLSSDQLAAFRRSWVTAGLCLLAVLAYLLVFGYLVTLGIRNQEHLLHDEEAEIIGMDSGDWLD